MSIIGLVDADLVVRRLLVEPQDVVYVKGILEASEGIGALFAETGGDLVIVTPRSRVCELDALLGDLATELDAIVK